MQILADSMIRRLMDEGQIKIDPAPTEKQMQPASVDLTLWKLYRTAYERMDTDRGLVKFRREEVRPVDGEYLIMPDEGYVFVTRERIDTGDGVHAVHIAPRSSMARSMVSLITGSVGHHLLNENGLHSRVYGIIRSHAFPIKIRQGERIAQAVFIANSKEKVRPVVLHAGGFMAPKEPVGVVDIGLGVKEAEMYENLDLDQFIIGHGGMLKFSTRESLDYSDGGRAAIVAYNGGRVDSDIGPASLNTGWAPFVDPGYKGKLSGIIMGTPVRKKVGIGSEVVLMYEFKVKGKVEKLYGSKNLGSHYSGGGK